MTVPIAAETAAARAARCVAAAGLTAVVEGGANLNLSAYGVAGDPPAAADQVLGQVITDTGCVVQDQGDGRILVQFSDSRLSDDRWTPDPNVTASELAFAQGDDVVNDVRVAYTGGAAVAQDTGSIAKYDRHSLSLQTQLADVGSAQNRASNIVGRLAYPAWAVEAITTWDAAFLQHTIGALVDVTPLPAGSPVEDPWTGVLEGWAETYQPATDGTQRVIGVFTLAIGDRAHSAESIHWGGVTPSLIWNGVDPQTAWFEAISNAALTP
jgi:hypothetical protein